MNAMSAAIVYVVDDDLSTRRALARLIRSVGLEVQTFPSAKAFLNYRRPNRPGCLVLDVRLPDATGLDLQSNLDQTGGDLPIIFITGYGDVSTSVRAMKGGAVDFLEKPVNDDDLVDCIQSALRRSHEQRAERAARAEVHRRLEVLTPREREVLMLVVTGKLNKQIAGDLGIAIKTVKIHRGRVMEKMQASSVADLVRMVEKLSHRSAAP
jgi:FixJ family two-component response regulator